MLFISCIIPNLSAERVTNEQILNEIRTDRRINEARFETIEQRFEMIDKRFETIEQRFEMIDKRFEAIEKRIDRIEKRIDSLRGLMLWGFGILFMGMFALVGFVLWDRRTAIAPVQRDTKYLMEREEKLEQALKKYAIMEPKLAEALKSVGIS
ncbi:MAG: hypothetical protein DRH57_06975 [Candidatus Cloacimonadota bacterium]|nr:MAG: hypothetical protein DRH57_06975 [Candidatus Cloacimonadota bacterium]